jgi:fructoselysine 6-kinase
MTAIVAIGDNDVDCYLSNGLMYPGGNCYNVAVYARRFGARSAYVGAMADDPAGRLMRGALEAEGVETTRLRTVEGLTAYCIIGHRDSDRVFLSNDFGVSRFTPDLQDIDYLGGFEAAHVGRSSGLDDWLEPFTSRTALSYDFSVQRDAAHMRRVAPLCWLASLSTGDLGREQAVELATLVKTSGARWVLATRGSDGAMLLGDDGLTEVPARPIQAVDTLGAGDTFITRTLVGLLRHEAPAQVLAAAADAAAETCTYFGAVGYGAPIDLPVPADRLHPALSRPAPAAG